MLADSVQEIHGIVRVDLSIDSFSRPPDRMSTGFIDSGGTTSHEVAATSVRRSE